MKAVVVGGGLAGVAAALRLADGGADVTLLERRQRLGGLTWSFQRHGRWFDNGQHVFLRCCDRYRAFLERIGTGDLVQLQPRLDVPVLAPNGRRGVIRRGRLPAPLHLAPSLLRYAHLPVGDRLRLGQAALALRRLDPDDRSLDSVTFAEWLSDHRQSPAAIARLWDLITLPTVNLPATEASLASAVRVFRTGLLDRADAGDIGWSRVPLQVLHGDASERALAAAGVDVRLGTAVESLDALGADAVVVATPPGPAARLLGAELDVLGVSPIVNVQIVFDRPVLDLPFAAGVGTPVQFVFDRGDGHVAISLSAADAYIDRPTPELVRLFTAALGELLPEAQRASVVDAVVTRERAATFRATSGAWAHRPGPVTFRPGVYLAGAWTDTGWPATMEGAVRSGEAAARAALSGDQHTLEPTVASGGARP